MDPKWGSKGTPNGALKGETKWGHQALPEVGGPHVGGAKGPQMGHPKGWQRDPKRGGDEPQMRDPKG